MNSAGLLALLIASAVPPAVSSTRLPPIDQCAAVPGFAEFRTALNAAIGRRDGKELLAMVSDDILATFGAGGSGKQEFAAAWGLAEPETSKVWDTLRSALALGCAWSGDALVSPSIIAQFDAMLDSFKTYIAVSPGAVLRDAPSQDGRVLLAMHWDVLTVGDADAGDGWHAVTLADGTKGFVRADEVRSVADYRAVFERRGGRWLITAFIAGD